MTRLAAPPTLLSACAFRSTLEGVLDVDGPAPVESGVETPTSSASGDGVEGADPKTPEASGPASPPAPATMLGAIPVPAAVPRLLARVGATGVDVVEEAGAPAGAELRAVDLGVGEFVDDAAPPVLGPRVMPRVDGGFLFPLEVQVIQPRTPAIRWGKGSVSPPGCRVDERVGIGSEMHGRTGSGR